MTKTLMSSLFPCQNGDMREKIRELRRKPKFDAVGNSTADKVRNKHLAPEGVPITVANDRLNFSHKA